MLTAAQIVAIACDAAHSPGKTAYAQLQLNAILSDLCRTFDVAEARGVFNFNFNPGLVPASLFGSGPYPLPLDYLRVSGSSGSSGAQKSYIWYLNGVPRPMVPVDLAEWDMMVQQAGQASYPSLWATDMGDLPDDRVVLATTAATTEGNAVVTAASITKLLVGQGCAGQGIGPGSVVDAINPGNSEVTLSLPATLTLTAASVYFGNAPQGYTFPPPSAALPVQIRYQKLMPPITDFSRIPWFANDQYLIEKLTGRMCLQNDDDRATLLLGGPEMPGSPDAKLTAWLAMKDAQTDRSKTVQLDRRRFGQSFAKLPITKTIGW